MAAIHVLTLSTSLLEFYYENMGLSNVGEEDAKEEFRRLQDEIIKARESAMPSTVLIRWETDYKTTPMVAEFAQQQNKSHNL